MTGNQHTAAAVDLQVVWAAVQARISPVLLSVVATLILSAIVIAAFPVRYETNDDVGMNLIAAGVFGSLEPDEHLIFTNVALSYPLSRLYRIAPDVPWYGLYQLLSVVSSATAINALLLSISRSGKQWVLLCLHFFAAIAPCLISIQFTKTAFLATEAGLLLLLAPWFFAQCRPLGWSIAGIALVLLGAAIRFDSFLLALVAASPIVAWAVWQQSSRVWKPVLVPLLTALAFCVVLQWAHQAYYAASPGWREFFEFNGYRHHIITRNGSLQYDEKTKPIFDAVGWSPADYLMLKNWFCSDPEVYSTAKLRQFAQGIALFESTLNGPQEIVARVQPSAGTLCLWAFIAANLLILRGWPSRFAVIGSFAFSSLLALAISAWLQHLPDRVLFSLFLPPAVLAVLTAGDGFVPLNVGLAGLLQRAGVFAAIAAGACAAQAWNEAGQLRLEVEDYAAHRLRLLQPYSRHIFVDWGGALPTQFLVTPLGSLDALRPFRCLGLGWGLRTPGSDRCMRELGIEDLPRALLSRDDLLLVCHRGALEILAQYLDEHEGAPSIEVGFIHQGDDRLFGDVVRILPVEQRSIP